jgi:uncharacterized protein YkwD
MVALMKARPFSLRLISALFALLGLSVAAVAQPYPHPYPGPPPALLAPPPRTAPALACQDGDQRFAQEAEALIALRIAAARAQFAPAAPRLAPDPDLTAMAQVRSCAMASGDADFSHTDTAGNFIAGRMVRERFGPYGLVGENIMEASGTGRSFGPEEFAKAAVDGWMKSPGHRADILSPRYDISGIGVARLGGQAVATQIFRGPPRTRDSDDGP